MPVGRSILNYFKEHTREVTGNSHHGNNTKKRGADLKCIPMESVRFSDGLIFKIEEELTISMISLDGLFFKS